MGSRVEAVKFISSTSDEIEPTYSPNGKQIAFTSRRSGSMEIWVCDSDGSHPEKLTSFGGPQPTGQDGLQTDNGLSFTPMPKAIGTSTSSAGMEATEAVGEESVQRWEPRVGQPMASGSTFSRTEPEEHKVWKVPVDGGEAVPVLGVRGGAPVESPDGKFIYYHKDDGIWRVPTNGGTENQVIDSIHPEGGWVVVAEGIYFISKPDDKGCFLHPVQRARHRLDSDNCSDQR